MSCDTTKTARDLLSTNSKNKRWEEFGISVFLLLAIGFIYAQTRNFEFINFDDNANVYLNSQVIKGLSLEGVRWAFTHTLVGHWTPLTILSHMVCCQLFGLEAGEHHLVNVFLHAITAILLFFVLQSMTGERWRSAFVTAVFAVHPLRVESVAWVTERKDVLSGIFFMLTLGAYVRYVRQPKSLARYALVMAMFTLGLMTKSMLVTLPFVLLLLDYWPLKRLEARPASLVLEKLPLFVLSIASCIIAILADKEGIMPVEKFPLHLRIENAFVSYAVYLRQMFYPVSLSAFYPLRTDGNPPWKLIPAVILLGSVSIVAIKGWRRRPYLPVGWFWYLGMLLPVIGIIQAGSVARADRYTYLPQIGIYLLITWGVADLFAYCHCPRWIVRTMAGLILTSLALCARVQTSYWRDSETLWKHAIASTEYNALAHNSLAFTLAKQKRVDEAIFHYQKALDLRPDLADLHFNLGNLLVEKGETDEAIMHFRKALEIEPGNADTHGSLGNALSRKGLMEEAIQQYQAGLGIKPDHAGIHTNLGLVFLEKGMVKQAIAQYEMALEADPQYSLALNNLAWVLATSPDASIRNGARAVELALRADQLTGGNDPNILDTLAAAYGEAGHLKDAVETAQRALQLATEAKNESLAKSLNRELVTYKSGTAYREPGKSQTLDSLPSNPNK